MAPRWSTKQELLCDSRASVPCCSGNNSARVANGERTNQEFSTDLPRRPPCAKRCQMKQDRMNKVYLPWCQFPPVSGFIWALQDFTSYDLVWSILCDILCDPVCISITCWHFSRCFGMFIVYKFLFVLKKKIIKAFLWKESASGKKMWPVSLVPLSTKREFLTHFLILLHPLLTISDKSFYPENLTPVPPLAKTNNKTLNPKRSA